MKAALLLAVLCAAQAHAFEPPTAIGAHVGSKHLDEAAPGLPAWNDANPGVYLRFDNVVVGTLRNSERRQSFYVGHVWQTERWHGIAADLTLGCITGYSQPISPLGAVGLSAAITDRTQVRITYSPKATPKGSAFFHLTIEWSIP